jgi:hypothetical protein
MAGETRPHIMSHGPLSNGRLSQVSMARRTGNPGSIVRCMAKFHMSVARKTVDALPGNLHVLISVFDDFLDFRFFPRQPCVTQHTFPDRRNASSSTCIRANMTIKAVQPQLHVCVVGKSDRLFCESRNAKNPYEQKTLRSKRGGSPQLPVPQRVFQIRAGWQPCEHHSSL